MPVNSSSSHNDTHTPSPPPFSLTMLFFMRSCLETPEGVINITAYVVTSTLVVLPLCILVLYIGVQRWLLQRSNTTIDLFTYHIVLNEIISILGSSLICCGVHAKIPVMLAVGIYLCSSNLLGQLTFQILSSVECYLAVVHPITYRSVKGTKRVTHIFIGIFWLLCIFGAGAIFVRNQAFIILIFVIVFSSTSVVVSFCSISVLCVLSHPGPGEKSRIDPSKLKAFYILIVILGVMTLRIANIIPVIFVYAASHTKEEVLKCGVWLSIHWFALPSSLLLPLLFLHRAGKLQHHEMLICKTCLQSP